MAPSNQGDFDGYRKWLGITDKMRPPTHYDLLGISLDEDDSDVIRAAVQQRRHYVETMRGEGHDAVVTEILYLIGEAEVTLLNVEMRRDYDRRQDLFEKRRKGRRIDPNASRFRVKSRPGKTVGEDDGIVKTFAGIVVVICVAFGGMAVFAFKVLPWSKPDQQTVAPAVPAAAAPAPAVPVPVAVPAIAPVQPVPIQVPESRSDALKFADLFNGRDLTGWNVIGVKSNWDVDASRVELVATGMGGIGWLLTDNEYADFVLRLEYQAEPGANSGIGILASPADFHQLEVQLVNGSNSATGGMWLPSGKGFSYRPPKQSVQEKPADDWNSLEIELRDRKLKTRVNGTEVSEFDLAELSSQPDSPLPLKRTKGRIGLQSHNNVVRFRNLRVAEIVTPSKSLE